MTHFAPARPPMFPTAHDLYHYKCVRLFLWKHYGYELEILRKQVESPSADESIWTILARGNEFDRIMMNVDPFAKAPNPEAAAPKEFPSLDADAVCKESASKSSRD